jgi:hypothetical protein
MDPNFHQVEWLEKIFVNNEGSVPSSVSEYENRFIDIIKTLYLADVLEKNPRDVNWMQYKSILINHYLGKVDIFRYYKPFITSFIRYCNEELIIQNGTIFKWGRIPQPELYLNPKYEPHFWELTHRIIVAYNYTHDNNGKDNGETPTPYDRYIQFQFPFIRGNDDYNRKMVSILNSFMIYMPNWLFYGYPMEYWYTITYSIMMKQFLFNQSVFGCIDFQFRDKIPEKTGATMRYDKDTMFLLFPSLYINALKENRIDTKNVEEGEKRRAIFSMAYENHDIYSNLIRLRRVLSFPSFDARNIVNHFVNQALKLTLDIHTSIKDTFGIITSPKPKLKFTVNTKDKSRHEEIALRLSVLPFICDRVTSDDTSIEFHVPIETYTKSPSFYALHYRINHPSYYHPSSCMVLRPIPLIYRKVLQLNTQSSLGRAKSGVNTINDRKNAYTYSLHLDRVVSALSGDEITRFARQMNGLDMNKVYCVFPQQIQEMNTRLKAFIDVIIENDIKPKEDLKELVTFTVRREFQLKFSSYFRYFTDHSSNLVEREEYIRKNRAILGLDKVNAIVSLMLPNWTLLDFVFNSKRMESNESNKLETEEAFLLY